MRFMNGFLLAPPVFKRILRKISGIFCLLLCSASLIGAIRYKRIVFALVLGGWENVCTISMPDSTVPLVVSEEHQQEKKAFSTVEPSQYLLAMQVLHLSLFGLSCALCVRRFHSFLKNQHKFITVTLERQTVK